MLALSRTPTTPQPTPAPVLDEASLQRLHELDPLGENRVVERVLRAFEASLTRLLPQSALALQQGDQEALRHVVHTLKSSSASVGALALSALCAQVEQHLRTAQPGDVGSLLDAMLGEMQRVSGAVQAMLRT